MSANPTDTQPPSLPPPLAPPVRILLGPGPSDVPPAVLAALAAPTVGHLDPYYLALMDQTRGMLQRVFRTRNPLTLAIPGTGSAGMEACIANLIQPGDTAIVGVAGVFGGRLAEMARRHGATVVPLEVPWGQTIDPAAVKAALASHPGCKLVALVHAETSTGAHQPLDGVADLVHGAGALLLVDAVTSLGGHALDVDGWGIDACYSGTQKCLSCPPGLAPVTFSAAAVAAMEARTAPVRSWYLDLSLIRSYWGSDRVYHHTAPINMTYALHQALRLVLEEGLDAREARHQLNHRALRAGLQALDISYVPARSLATLNAIHVPAGVDDARVRRRLLEEYGIEIGGGLGPLKGKAWRIGLMGASSTRRNVTAVLSALESLLRRERGGAGPAGAVAAADAVYG